MKLTPSLQPKQKRSGHPHLRTRQVFESSQRELLLSECSLKSVDKSTMDVWFDHEETFGVRGRFYVDLVRFVLSEILLSIWLLLFFSIFQLSGSTFLPKRRVCVCDSPLHPASTCSQRKMSNLRQAPWAPLAPTYRPPFNVKHALL